MKTSIISIITLIMILLMSVCACSKKTEDPKTTSNNPTTQSIVTTSKNEQTPVLSEENFIENTDKIVSKTELTIYDGPEYLTEFQGLTASVNGRKLFVYETRVNHSREFSWTTPTTTAPVVIFDFEGRVHMEIVVDEMVTSAKVTPSIYGINPSIDGNKISFDLNYSANYCLEYNDDSTKMLHIFANPIEEETITKEMADKDDSIIYIGPGVYKADAIPVESNTTLYIAGGAYVYGQIRTEGLENIKIKGRGIISGYIYNRRDQSEYTIPIEIRTCSNVEIEGITILDPAGWTIALYKSTDVTLNNVKIVTARQNGDGISVQACSNVTVNGGFVRTWDDSLVVKNVDHGSTSNIKFDGVTVWTDLAQSMEVGYECNGDTMDGITFENIIVLHNFHKAVISMHNADDAKISNVTYRNIIVEDCETLGDNRNDGENDFLIDLCILYNTDWSNSIDIKGTVRDVVIENVKVLKIAPTVVSRINGYSNASNIEGVSIKNVEISGKAIKSTEDLGLLINSYSSKIDVISDSKTTGSIIKLPYSLDIKEESTMKVVENIRQNGMMVPDFARGNGELAYIGESNEFEYTINATHGAGTLNTTPGDDGSGDFTLDGSNALNILDDDPSTSWINKEWKGEKDEFATLTIDFKGELLNVGVIRLLGNPDNDFYYTYTIQVWGRKIKTNGEINDKYTKIVSTKDYEMTPAKNNCIDINISPQQYAGLQIRFYKNDYDSSPNYYEISEIELFSPSLTYMKAIVDSTEHNDVYPVEKLVDGKVDGTSYYESSSLPATVVIDLGDIYDLSTIVLFLPPSLLWSARSEEIEILGSASTLEYNRDTTKFDVLVEKTSYLFDPQTGNRNVVNLDEPQKVRYLKIVIYSNDISAGYQAQLSEISAYGK